MTSDKKNNISLITTIISSIIVVGTIFYNFVEKQTKNDDIYNTQIEINSSIKELNDNAIWMKTTLIDHIKAEEEKDKKVYEDMDKLRDNIIESNNHLIEVFKKP